ncbi:3-isopropylmalate dehydrogenase, partial [Pseudomonas sp. MPR-R5A]
DKAPAHVRPEKGLLKLRKDLNLYANLRPTSYYESLADSSPLRKEVIQDVDMLIVRELTGGLYFGKPSERVQDNGQDAVVDTLYYQKAEMYRV